MERGNHLGTDRSVVRQSKLFRQNESGNAMKGLLGQENLSWDTEKKQGVFAGQHAFDASAGGPSPLAPAPAPRPAPAVSPYNKGDSVLYTGRDGSVLQVTVSHVSTNVPLGEEPEISVRMPDGNVRETVLARLSPAPLPATTDATAERAAAPDAYTTHRHERTPGHRTGNGGGATPVAHGGANVGGIGGIGGGSYSPTATSRRSGDPGYRGSWEEREHGGHSRRQPVPAPAPAPASYSAGYDSRSYGAGPGRSSSSSSGTGASSRRHRSPHSRSSAQHSRGRSRSSSSSSGKGSRPMRSSSSSSSHRSSDRDRSTRGGHSSRDYYGTYGGGSSNIGGGPQADPHRYGQAAAGGAHAAGGRGGGASSGATGRWETSSQAAYNQDPHRFRR